MRRQQGAVCSKYPPNSGAALRKSETKLFELKFNSKRAYVRDPAKMSEVCGQA